MSRHQLIDHVQLNKVKFIKQTVGVCHSSVLRNGAIKRKWRRIDKPNERLWGRHKRVVLLLRRAASHNYKTKRAQKILLANSNTYINTEIYRDMHKYRNMQRYT